MPKGAIAGFCDLAVVFSPQYTSQEPGFGITEGMVGLFDA
jgi:hypothetical protein